MIHFDASSGRRTPPGLSPPVDLERRECKFLFPGGDVAALRDVLSINARPIAFGWGSFSRVSSIYFDDARMTSFIESCDGVPRRVKLRLRWYDADFGRRCFFELKHRRGTAVRKERVPFELSAPIDGIPYDTLLGKLFAGLDERKAALLARRSVPTVLVSYRREHFVDPESGVRLTLDYDVEGFVQLGAARPTRHLGESVEGLVVVEAKAPEGEQLAVRRVLFPLTPRLRRCSKYAHCCLLDRARDALRVHD